jgi:hypothetical protein
VPVELVSGDIRLVQTGECSFEVWANGQCRFTRTRRDPLPSEPRNETQNGSKVRINIGTNSLFKKNYVVVTVKPTKKGRELKVYDNGNKVATLQINPSESDDIVQVA